MYIIHIGAAKKLLGRGIMKSNAEKYIKKAYSKTFKTIYEVQGGGQMPRLAPPPFRAPMIMSS